MTPCKGRERAGKWALQPRKGGMSKKKKNNQVSGGSGRTRGMERQDAEVRGQDTDE